MEVIAMSKIATEWLVKILLPMGAIALIIGALTAPEKTATAFVLFLLILLGVWSVLDPESAFMFGRRWQFRRADPSDIALLLTQIGGIVIVLTSIITLVIVLFFR